MSYSGAKASWLSSDVWRAVILLLLSVYTFIPYETASEGLSLQLRGAVAIVFIFYVLRSTKFRLDRSASLFLLLAFFMVAFAALVSFSGRFFLTLTSIVLAVIVCGAAERDSLFRSDLARALEWLLVFSSGALLLQLVVWHGTGELLRIHEIFFPLSEARVEEHGAFARLGGLYIEPGTFANWSCVIFIVYQMLAVRTSPTTSILVAGAMITSLSAWGVAAGTVILLSSGLAVVRRAPVLAATIFSLAGLVLSVILSSDVLDFLQRKTELESESGDSKVMAVNEFIRSFDGIVFLGKGFAPDFCSGCLAPQDAGVFIGFSVVFGVLFSAALFLGLYLGVFRRLGFLGGMVALFVPISKVFYWDFVLWILLLLSWQSFMPGRRVRE